MKRVIGAIVAAATSGHTPSGLADHLDKFGASTRWAALGAALRRILGRRP